MSDRFEPLTARSRLLSSAPLRCVTECHRFTQLYRPLKNVTIGRKWLRTSHIFRSLSSPTTRATRRPFHVVSFPSRRGGSGNDNKPPFACHVSSRFPFFVTFNASQSIKQENRPRSCSRFPERKQHAPEGLCVNGCALEQFLIAGTGRVTEPVV